MHALPRFAPDEYQALLVALRAHGYALGPVSDPRASGIVHLRHDIDFFPEAALPIARIEAALGARATYYALLSGPYNVHAPHTRQALRALVGMGHEIGLHYDLETFPDDPSAARAELDHELATLSACVDAPVTTISTHQPHRGGDDPFRSLPGLSHPHDPTDARPLMYVSDSCRAWRDETLLACLGAHPPARIMLLTHPELWLDGAVGDRLSYLRDVLTPTALAPLQRYFREDVATIWREHAGARAHDVREGTTRATGTPSRLVSRERDDAVVDRTRTAELGVAWRWPNRAWVETNIAAFESRFATFHELPWTREQILRDVTGKWDHSLVALWAPTRVSTTRDNAGDAQPTAPAASPSSSLHAHGTIVASNLLAFSFNSLREGRLYVHAFFVAPHERTRGLGSAMLAALKDRARTLGLQEVGLRVDRANPAGLRWWLARGFRVVGLDENDGPLVLAAHARES